MDGKKIFGILKKTFLFLLGAALIILGYRSNEIRKEQIRTGQERGGTQTTLEGDSVEQASGSQ